MIKIFIEGRKHRTNAKALYNEKTREVTVLKGSVVSETVSEFRHNDSIIHKRVETCEDGIVKKDIVFPNPTVAAQYVCGYSVSGPVAWHVEKHKNLSEWLKEKE